MGPERSAGVSSRAPELPRTFVNCNNHGAHNCCCPHWQSRKRWATRLRLFGTRADKKYLGPEVTPRHRTLIVTLCHGIPELGVPPKPVRTVAMLLGIPKSTCFNIYRHTYNNALQKRTGPTPPVTMLPSLSGNETTTPSENAAMPRESSGSAPASTLLITELICSVNPNKRTGRKKKLSTAELDNLVATAKRDWGTRHMTLRDLQLEAGLGHVSRSLVHTTLLSKGIHSYIEEKKFILSEENKKRRMVSLLDCDWNSLDWMPSRIFPPRLLSQTPKPSLLWISPPY